MSGNKETLQLNDSKRMVDDDTERLGEAAGPVRMEEEGMMTMATDTREDERHSQASREVRDEEEDPVFLVPRFSSSYDMDDDILSLQACTSSNGVSDWFYRAPHHQAQAFLRQSPPSPQIPDCLELPSPSSANSNGHTDDKPSLCRSLAWSQDSMEERRYTKRSRIEDMTFTPTSVHEESFSFSGYGHKRNDSSPTMVHWEEKVVDSIDLVGVLQRAVAREKPRDLQE